MQIETPLPETLQEKPDQKDPGGFVMSMALALFGITLIAMLTMQLAQEYGWQVL